MKICKMIFYNNDDKIDKKCPESQILDLLSCIEMHEYACIGEGRYGDGRRNACAEETRRMTPKIGFSRRCADWRRERKTGGKRWNKKATTGEERVGGV